MVSIVRNIAWGAKGGLALAAAYSAVVTCLFIIGGPSRFERLGITLGTAVACYFVSGILGGAIVGLLRPLTKRKPGAIAACIAGAVPLAVALAVTVEGMPSRWGPDVWFAMAFVSILAGVTFGTKLAELQR